MKPNPVLKHLGLTSKDRAVVLHADDLGMSQSTIDAFDHMADYGLLRSASVMVPCPWFREAAYAASLNPTWDIGVHLTLTSEWNRYRWSPISTRSRSSGLIDNDGSFFKGTAGMVASVNPVAAVREMKAQLQKAREYGIDVTHLDSHMFAAHHMPVSPTYIQLAIDNNLPCFFLGAGKEHWPKIGGYLGLQDVSVRQATVLAKKMADLKRPLFDQAHWMSLEKSTDRLAELRETLDGLGNGQMMYLMTHPATDTPETRAISADWPSRVADYRLFIDPRTKRYFKDCGIAIIEYRMLREYIRTTCVS